MGAGCSKLETSTPTSSTDTTLAPSADLLSASGTPPREPPQSANGATSEGGTVTTTSDGGWDPFTDSVPTDTTSLEPHRKSNNGRRQHTARKSSRRLSSSAFSSTGVASSPLTSLTAASGRHTRTAGGPPLHSVLGVTFMGCPDGFVNAAALCQAGRRTPSPSTPTIPSSVVFQDWATL